MDFHSGGNFFRSLVGSKEELTAACLSMAAMGSCQQQMTDIVSVYILFTISIIIIIIIIITIIIIIMSAIAKSVVRSVDFM
jgi:heme/copper-type cytochrome/quinol oxidase subunit 2